MREEERLQRLTIQGLLMQTVHTCSDGYAVSIRDAHTTRHPSDVIGKEVSCPSMSPDENS